MFKKCSMWIILVLVFSGCSQKLNPFATTSAYGNSASGFGGNISIGTAISL